MARFKDVMKVTALSLASVGVFGAALFGANQLAFVNAASRTLVMPPIEAMSVTLANTVPLTSANGTEGVVLSAEVTPRNLIVNETIFEAWGWSNDHARGENTLSAEEAAQIGAQHIYEIFGKCIDGFAVQMAFNGHLRHGSTLGVWTGTVGDGVISECLSEFLYNNGHYPVFSVGRAMFIFMLNAETGEAIHVERISYLGEMVMLTPLTDYPITMEYNPWANRDGQSVFIFPGPIERRVVVPDGWNPPEEWGMTLEEWKEAALNPYAWGLHRYPCHPSSPIRRITPINPPRFSFDSIFPTFNEPQDNGNGRQT